MDKIKLLTVLVSIVLFLSLINLFATYNLNTKFDSINEPNITAEPTLAPQPTTANPAPTQQPLNIQVSSDDDPVKGSNDAPVTMIEFSDYECPFCGKYYQQTFSLIEENYIQTGKVKYVFRDYPLKFHQHAKPAAEATECADEQGKYWEYHKILFENQNALDNESLKQYALDLGLDGTAFNECLDSGRMASEVETDFQDGISYGITGTPSFFINGNKVVGAKSYEVFQQLIDKELNNT
ncbi:MAG TPA: DsbA family protein [archaeon]|nr:DsbA family protein [archaeon]